MTAHDTPANPFLPRRPSEAVDPRTLARFPFLKEASDHVKAQGIRLGDVLTARAWGTARDRGRERVYQTLEDLEKTPPPDVPLSTEQEQWREILSYPISRMIVSAVADSYLVRRYALAEALRASARLAQEDGRFVNHVAAQLDLDFTADGGTARLHFLDFLRCTSTLRGKEWKLVNQAVDGGYVVLRLEKALRVLQNAVQRKIERELPIEIGDDVGEAFADDVRELRRLLVERKARFRQEDLGRGDIGEFPPCMQKILAEIQAHENVAHMGRFAIVAFLHTTGFTNEEIFKLFGDVPDFAVDVTKYQIEHITGTTSPTEYTPPECSTMKSYGICPGGDSLCHQPWMTHPLKYYRYKRRRAPRRPPPPTAAPPAPG